MTRGFASGASAAAAGTRAAGDGYKVLNQELTGHAGKVQTFSERLKQAVDAARQVTMNDEAFGVICQPFAMLLNPFEHMGVQALEKASETVNDSAGKVREAAAKYGESEQQMSDAVKKVGGVS